MRKENFTTNDTDLRETPADKYMGDGDAWTRYRKQLEAYAEAGTKIIIIDNLMMLSTDN